MTDLDAILAEMDRYGGMPEIQPGDVTVDDLKRHWHVTDVTAKRRAMLAVEAGAFETMMVYDPEIGRVRRVWRKIAGGS
jgi:hypothetical protein